MPDVRGTSFSNVSYPSGDPLRRVPVTVFFLVRSVLRYEASTAVGVGPLAIASMVLLGMFAWTFAEYILHKFVFH